LKVYKEDSGKYDQNQSKLYSRMGGTVIPSSNEENKNLKEHVELRHHKTVNGVPGQHIMADEELHEILSDRKEEK
jgi:hypothetical protein